MIDASGLYPPLEVVWEGLRWAMLEAGDVVVVREIQVLRGGQMEGVVLMQWNVVLLLCCLL